VQLLQLLQLLCPEAAAQKLRLEAAGGSHDQGDNVKKRILLINITN
jgi:hypothetical protein